MKLLAKLLQRLGYKVQWFDSDNWNKPRTEVPDLVILAGESGQIKLVTCKRNFNVKEHSDTGLFELEMKPGCAHRDLVFGD